MSQVKNQLKTALKILLTGGALILVFQKIDTAQLLQLSKNLSWPWLFPAIVLFVGSKVATAIRLNHYFANIPLLLSAWENWRLYLIGMFYNLFLPGGIGGDGYKVYLLNKEFKTPVKELLKASLLDRLGGLVAIVALLLALLGLIELPWQGFATWTSKALLLAAALGMVPAFWLLQKVLFPNFLPSFWQGIIWSLVGQLAQMASVFCLLLALGVQDNFLAYQAVFLLSSIVAVLPLTIGGVGARELVVVYAHSYAGIQETEAVAFSLLFFLISAAVSLSGAWIKWERADQK
jgi:glycosyltransferase 2 family protein